MVNPWRRRAVVITLSVVALAACSSTQPDHISTRNASLTFAASGDLGSLDCYEIWQDTSNPLDGFPDVFLDQSQCFENLTPPQQRPLPWHFSVIITVIRSGTTFEDLVFSDDGVPGTTSDPRLGLDEYFSMTDFDPSEPPAVLRDPDGDIYYLNGKEVTWGSRVYQSAYSASCPNCPLDVGTPNIAGGSPSFDFALNSGDTVLVRVRKQTISHSPGYLPVGSVPNIKLTAQLSIGGVPVATNGAMESSNIDGSTLSFSYTVK